MSRAMFHRMIEQSFRQQAKAMAKSKADCSSIEEVDEIKQSLSEQETQATAIGDSSSSQLVTNHHVNSSTTHDP